MIYMPDSMNILQGKDYNDDVAISSWFKILIPWLWNPCYVALKWYASKIVVVDIYNTGFLLVHFSIWSKQIFIGNHLFMISSSFSLKAACSLDKSLVFILWIFDNNASLNPVFFFLDHVSLKT